MNKSKRISKKSQTRMHFQINKETIASNSTVIVIAINLPTTMLMMIFEKSKCWREKKRNDQL
jgi:hypothetical protein